MERYKYKYINKEVDVNSTLIEVIQGMNQSNFMDCVLILKKKFGVQYNIICDVMGVSHSVLKKSISLGTIEGVVSEQRLAEGILMMQLFYLGEDYMNVEIEVEGEKEAEIK